MNIADYAQGTECIELTASQIEILSRPGVYVYTLATGKTQYIGSSHRMLQRATRKDHGQAGASYHSIIFIPCKDLAAARALEQELIAELRPPLNKRGGMRIWADRLSLAGPSSASTYIKSLKR